MKKLAFKIFVFTIVFAVVLKCVVDPIFNKNNSFKNSIEQLNELDKDSLDILILGSSHARNSYNTEIIDKALHINSFSLASDGQKIAVTNNLLENVLKRIKPKLLILDVFPGSLDYPELDKQKSYQLQVFDNSKWTTKKFRLMTSMYSFNELPSALSPTIRNHENWNIANWTFAEQRLDSSLAIFNKGFAGYYSIIKDKERLSLLDYEQKKDRYLKFDDYKEDLSKLNNKLLELRKTIEISKNNNVELLLVSSPYFDAFYGRGASDFHFLVKLMCNEYGIKFLDFNTKFDELGLTLDDFRDRSHLNLSGADKVTGRLAKFLIDKQYFELDENRAKDLSKKLKSLSNTFKLYFEKKLNEEIFPNVFVNQISFYQSNEQRKIELTLDKKEGVRDVINRYNLEFAAFPFAKDKKLLPDNFKGSKKEFYTFYTLKDINNNGQNKITIIFPKSDISIYENARLFSFVKTKKRTGHRYNIDFPNLNLSNIIESKFVNKETTNLNSLFGRTEKLWSEFFEFNDAIKTDEIAYINSNENTYTFLFKINQASIHEEFKNFIGYIRYYNGEINDTNKKVKTFPLSVFENNKNKYIVAKIGIANTKTSKFDVFFQEKESKKASRLFSLKDVKLINDPDL